MMMSSSSSSYRQAGCGYGPLLARADLWRPGEGRADEIANTLATEAGLNWVGSVWGKVLALLPLALLPLAPPWNPSTPRAGSPCR